MTEKIEIDLREIGRGLLKRAWIIVLCAVVLGAGFLVYTIGFVTPMYQADVTMYVNNNYETQSEALSSNDLAVALRLVNSYVVIVQSDVVLDAVAEAPELADLNLTAAALKGMVSAEVVDETEIFKITVTSDNPHKSARIANAVAQVAPSVIKEIIPGSASTPLNYAKVPTTRSSPNYVLNALLGVVVGAVLATVAILIHMHFDVHVKTETMMENICNVPVLGVIPDFAETTRRPTRKGRR